jgi:uncharacterized protein YjbI with pentapeptide repeats
MQIMIREENTLPDYPQCPPDNDPVLWQAYSDEWFAYHERYKDQFPRNEDMPDWNEYRSNWRNYWVRLGFQWRTEPSLSSVQQQILARYLASPPDPKKGIYPFGGIKLTRADVEWLLETHENGRGPVDWSDASQRERVGLDLRGANLSRENLSNLPLSYLRGGLTSLESRIVPKEQSAKAIIHLANAYLRTAHLEGAILREADMRHAYLKYAHFEAAYLRYARLGGARLGGAFFDSATLLDYIDLNDEQGQSASLGGVHWANVDITGIAWSKVKVLGDERKAKDVARERKQGIGQEDSEENASIDDDNEDFDDNEGFGPKDNNERDEQKRFILKNYQKAARAYRQLVVVLQSQGLNEEAANYAYRAQTVQRIIYRREKRYPSYLFSWLLNLSAGYGYRPFRFIFASVVILLLFWSAYYILALVTGTHTTLLSALALSIQNFFTPDFKLQDGTLQAFFSAFEGLCGLFIAAILIAIVTQRILGK